ENVELENAINIAQKKLRIASGNPQTLMRRTYATLARKGFSPSICSKAIAIAQERLA
ncbi:MAG: RecX family transcriptional regulator, partial [Actinomycetaceae bacterium]|nr:RecX family transcriptional regulator [Actinomycetaceae bacterium]